MIIITILWYATQKTIVEWAGPMPELNFISILACEKRFWSKSYVSKISWSAQRIFCTQQFCGWSVECPLGPQWGSTFWLQIVRYYRVSQKSDIEYPIRHKEYQVLYITVWVYLGDFRLNLKQTRISSVSNSIIFHQFCELSLSKCPIPYLKYASF